MGLWVFVEGGRLILFRCYLLFLTISLAAASIVLIGENVSMSFDDTEAKFAPKIKGSGECGVLYIAEPLDACTPLTNQIAEGLYSPFVLIIRGGCTFDYKVKSAQQAGFKAAIIYDNKFDDGLVSMAGTSSHIHIHAVFVSGASGRVLKKYAGRSDVEFWIIPTFENAAWSIMAISFMSLLAMSAMLATCFFVRRHHIRREQSRAPNIREFHGMSGRLVKAMPSLIFTSVLEDNCTSRTCAICLEDYNVGEKLRILPCRHKFHAVCVDAWLTTWRTFCPMCKQDARTSTGISPPSESTPLLFSGVAAPASSMEALSSFRSSLATSSSPAIPIMPTPPRISLTSRNHSLSSIPRMHGSQRSYSNSLAIRASRSTFDLINASFERSYTSCLASPRSLGYPSSSPINSRYISPVIPSSSKAFPSFLPGSSGQMSYSRHCAESATNLSGMSSAQSLPGC